ncbi:MAG: GAF domain-containing protein, partial [candidate division NC10 bacterium]|nr:GAF domain-containing protein [candidate division NC10 bacterium]
MKQTGTSPSHGKAPVSLQKAEELLREIVAHLRKERDALRRTLVSEMVTRELLKGLTPHEGEAEAATIYDALVECLETGRYHSAQAYAHTVAERGVVRGIGAKHVIGGLLALRDICGRALYQRYHRRPGALMGALDVYEPVVNRILTIVALAFVQEREKAVGRGREQLAALVEAGMTLAAERSLESVLERIAEVACRLLGARYGALGILDEKGGLGQFITAGIDEEGKARIGPLPVGKGILGVLVREAKPLRLRDLTQDPRAHGFPPNHPPMRSFLGVPIISKGRVFGNLYLTEKQGAEEFSKEDEKLAVTLAAQAAIAIENASLYEELRRSYDELKQSQHLLVRQEKLASLGRLAAGLAHELNNPLSSVAGFAEALQRRAGGEGVADQPGATEFQEYLTMIQAEVSRAAAIVRRLLDFARQREPAFGPIDLQGVVAEAVSFVERQASLANQRITVAPERPLRRWRPSSWTLLLAFPLIIAAGTVLLSLPFATQEGVRAPLMTALFTATSATCVTGLAVVDTGPYWSGFGQGVILALIEVGGLSYMTGVAAILLAAGQRVTLSQRQVLRLSLGGGVLGRVDIEALEIVAIAFLVQVLGSLVLFGRFFALGQEPGSALWLATFHAVAAFNNAGFDITGG